MNSAIKQTSVLSMWIKDKNKTQKAYFPFQILYWKALQGMAYDTKFGSEDKPTQSGSEWGNSLVFRS